MRRLPYSAARRAPIGRAMYSVCAAAWIFAAGRRHAFDSDEDLTVRVLILGVGDAFSRHHYGSSALIEAPGGYVLIDCPDLIHRVLRQATGAAGWNVDASDVSDVLITHLHGDHTNGLESFAYARMILRHQNGSAPIPRLFTNRPASKRVWEKLAPAMDEAWIKGPGRKLSDFFDLRTLDPDTPATVAGLTVRCRFTQHVVPTTGLLISDGRTTFGWSGDTTFDEAHLKWLSEADLIVHEAGGGAVHTPVERLNEQPDALRRKLRLIHLPDEFDASKTDIRPLAEGEVLEL